MIVGEARRLGVQGDVLVLLAGALSMMNSARAAERFIVDAHRDAYLRTSKLQRKRFAKMLARELKNRGYLI
jgi:hypothetical protein